MAPDPSALARPRLLDRVGRTLLRRSVTLALGSLIWMATGPARAAISLAVLPAETVVEPGQTFDVRLEITQTGTAFNGYDAVVGYDPAVLTFLKLSPLSQQEGPLMTVACPQRFHVFSVATDSSSVSIAHVLLCAGVDVTGPGTIYKLRFQAKGQPAVTALRFLEGTAFYDAGLTLPDLTTTDGSVRIVQSTASPQAPPAPLAALPALVNLAASPNPFNPRVQIAFELPAAAPVTITIYESDGRRVAALLRASLPAGPHALSWDGRDDEGRPVGSGVYIVRWTARMAAGATRIALIR